MLSNTVCSTLPPSLLYILGSLQFIDLLRAFLPIALKAQARLPSLKIPKPALSGLNVAGMVIPGNLCCFPRSALICWSCAFSKSPVAIFNWGWGFSTALRITAKDVPLLRHKGHAGYSKFPQLKRFDGLRRMS